jgi:hypothetical protein
MAVRVLFVEIIRRLAIWLFIAICIGLGYNAYLSQGSSDGAEQALRELEQQFKTSRENNRRNIALEGLQPILTQYLGWHSAWIARSTILLNCGRGDEALTDAE